MSDVVWTGAFKLSGWERLTNENSTKSFVVRMRRKTLLTDTEHETAEVRECNFKGYGYPENLFSGENAIDEINPDTTYTITIRKVPNA